MSHIGKVYQETKLDLIGMYLTGWEVKFRTPEPLYGVFPGPSSVIDYIHRYPPQIIGSLSPVSGNPNGDFLLVKPPKTTVETLAVAVLKGEPCGRELIDCLIEEGVVDVDKAAADEAIRRAKVDILRKVNEVVAQIDAVTETSDFVGYRFYDLAQHIIGMIRDIEKAK